MTVDKFEVCCYCERKRKLGQLRKTRTGSNAFICIDQVSCIESHERRTMLEKRQVAG